jgi:hypothetical protein
MSEATVKMRAHVAALQRHFFGERYRMHLRGAWLAFMRRPVAVRGADGTLRLVPRG